jgi:acyl carrier protein
MMIPESHKSAEQHFRNGHGDVLAVLCSAVDEINQARPRGRLIGKSLSTPLFGSEGSLDSVTLANFIVIAEDKLEAFFGFRVDLTQDDPFAPETGHFRTVQSLVDYVAAMLQQRSSAAGWGSR